MCGMVVSLPNLTNNLLLVKRVHELCPPIQSKNDLYQSVHIMLVSNLIKHLYLVLFIHFIDYYSVQQHYQDSWLYHFGQC